MPGWIKAHTPIEWNDRSEMRMEHVRFPQKKSKQEALADQISRDGWHLLVLICGQEAPPWLREAPAVEVLRRVWVQQFWVQDRQIRWRPNDAIPPASKLTSSPSDHQARMSITRRTVWTGDNVHLTETCDDHTPHLIIHVEITPATIQNTEITEVIHQGLERKQVLPR
jgi:transposase